MMLRMLRVSIVPSLGERPAEGGPAAALLQAIGGLEAFRRSVPGPADAYPVARFLLFERELSALGRRRARAAARTAHRRRSELSHVAAAAAPRAPARGAGVPPRAPLRGRARRAAGRAARAGRRRALGGRRRDREALLRRRRGPAARGGAMKFQITYWTGYEYSEPVRDNLNVLRVKPATTRHQTVEDFSFRVEPEARLHQYRDYFGSEVIEFGVTEPHERLGIEAKMRVTTVEQEVDPNEPWSAIESEDYRADAGEFLLSRTTVVPEQRSLRARSHGGPRRDAAADAARGRRRDPGAVRVPGGCDLRRLDRRRPARRRRGRLPGLRPPRRDDPAQPWDRRALRLRLPVRGLARTAARSRSRCRPTPGSRG